MAGSTPECPGGAGWPPRRESADAAPVRSSKVDAKSTNPQSIEPAQSHDGPGRPWGLDFRNLRQNRCKNWSKNDRRRGPRVIVLISGTRGQARHQTSKGRSGGPPGGRQWPWFANAPSKGESGGHPGGRRLPAGNAPAYRLCRPFRSPAFRLVSSAGRIRERGGAQGQGPDGDRDSYESARAGIFGPGGAREWRPGPPSGRSGRLVGVFRGAGAVGSLLSLKFFRTRSG